jgi:hypothetical protein
MEEAGFGADLIRGICRDNWIGFLSRRLPKAA